MPEVINIYCDESCHLPDDRQPFMVLGAVWCAADKTHEIAKDLRDLKLKHRMPAGFELKWNRVSKAKLDYYLDVMDYFFGNPGLHFRAWVASKAELDHEVHQQTHDDWYYKMMFGLIEPLLSPAASFRLYLDIKDTRSSDKVRKLHDVLCNNMYDFNQNILERVQVLESAQVQQLQLADFLIGAVSYVNRGLSSSSAKTRLVKKITEKTSYSLLKSTLMREEKFNLFVWKGNKKAS
jgi:hypothetical protein